VSSARAAVVQKELNCAAWITSLGSRSALSGRPPPYRRFCLIRHSPASFADSAQNALSVVKRLGPLIGMNSGPGPGQAMHGSGRL